MNKRIPVLTALAMITCLSSLLFAAEQDWRIPFVTALQDGKTATTAQARGEGLAYTASEEQVLMDAVSKAIKLNAPICECMKIAIDLEYNPYSVLKSIYSAGGDVELDQLCMCATEAGIMKAIVAKAAMDAISSTGEALFDRDEVSQCQCLKGEEGLAYTPEVEEDASYSKPLSQMKSVRTASAEDQTLVSVSK